MWELPLRQILGLRERILLLIVMGESGNNSDMANYRSIRTGEEFKPITD
jgi:hypothetical protein